MTPDDELPWAARRSTHRILYVLLGIVLIAWVGLEGYAKKYGRLKVEPAPAIAAPAPR
jgi:hypothetical protein